MTPDLFAPALRTAAEMSSCGRYRYTLARIWDVERPEAIFIMLNPSTADANVDDPTIRRRVSFARVWKAGAVVVLNLFAFRATDPSELYGAVDPIGPHNEIFIAKELDRIVCTRSRVVCAWGAHGGYLNRDRWVLSTVRQAGIVPVCLGTTAGGFPRHPLYVKGLTPLRPYEGRP